MDRPNEPVFYFPTKTIEWDHDSIEIDLIPEDTRDKTFLQSLSPGRRNVAVAYDTNVALATIVAVRQVMTVAPSTSFRVRLRPEQTDFSTGMDVGLGNTSADQLAKMGARRLLLGEYPSQETSDLNEITKDLFIGGQGTVLRITGSAFPGIYQQFRKEPIKFLEIAWIAAASQLVLSNCVAVIDSFHLELVPEGLRVEFRGLRQRRFVNQSPFEIDVHGISKLTSPSEYVQPTAYMDQLGPRLHGLSSKISLVRATPQIAERAAELVSELEALLSGLPPR